MAILSVTKNLGEMRKRISRVVLAHDKNGNEVTTADLEVDGAMTAWMTDTINPTLLQTIEGQPVLVHAGPFANIAIGQSSIIADLVGLKLSDYHIAESGFGSNIGYEKFWNLKCRLSNLKPDAVVIVATVRALKMHGGGPPVKPGSKLAPQYEQENLELVEKGCENLKAHIDIVKKSGIKPVVCVNKFHTDTKDEIKLVNKIAEQYGAVSVTSNHWLKGGEGAIELADAVISACEDENHFHYLYPQKMPLAEKIETIAKQIYGAAGVTYSSKAKEKAEIFQEKSWPKKFGTCMLKTRLSLSHDPNLKGRPRNWELPIKDFYVYKGAELIVPIAGQVKLMPGTGSDPAYRRIDVDTQTGKVTGLF